MTTLAFANCNEAMLGTYAYEVLVAEGGHQALNLFRSKTKEIDAVISDYEMPGMNGAQLAAELKRYDPETPVIVISGFLPILEQTPYFVDAAVPKGGVGGKDCRSHRSST
jgi:CheY-like chemotaxis protein